MLGPTPEEIKAAEELKEAKAAKVCRAQPVATLL